MKTRSKKTSIVSQRKKALRAKAKKPAFRRQNWFRHKRLSRKGWRKPRGIHNKIRHRIIGKPARPHPGYGSQKICRGIHPSGYEEVYIENLKKLNSVNPETQAARLSGSLGKKARSVIVSKANELKIKVLNK